MREYENISIEMILLSYDEVFTDVTQISTGTNNGNEGEEIPIVY